MRFLNNYRTSQITPYSIQWFFGMLSVMVCFFIRMPQRHVVLTAFHGDGYRGNTKILFEHLQKDGELHAVWLSRNKTVVKNLKKKFGNDSAHLIHSFKGMMLLCRAGVVCVTHGTSDFPFMKLNRNSLLIQTYHGLPTKRGEFMRPSGSTNVNFFHKRILNYRFKQIDYFLSSSEFVTEIFSQRFGLKKQQLPETGFPAYDQLMKANKPAFNIAGGEKLILYAPTFRRTANTKWFPFPNFNLDDLYSFLEDNNARIGLRPHPNESANIKPLLSMGKRIFLADDSEFEDINKLILSADVIVTDYSGIYLEGLLRDIPPVFIPYDFENYERGFPFDYFNVTPGPKVSTQQEFMKNLEDALSGAPVYSKDRQRVKNLFFSNTDGRSTQRVSSFLEKYLEAGQVNLQAADLASSEFSVISTGA